MLTRVQHREGACGLLFSLSLENRRQRLLPSNLFLLRRGQSAKPGTAEDPKTLGSQEGHRGLASGGGPSL